MDRRSFIRKSALAATSAVVAGMGVAELFAEGQTESRAGKLNPQKMKIVVLTGSPRRNGNTNHLADRFIEGAKERGHEVFRFDCAARDVAPCMACNHCGMNGECVLQDDFGLLRPRLIEADMVVFVTPMYYFGFSAQLKRVIDRFYAINGTIKGSPKKTALIMAYADTAEREAQAMLTHYGLLADYLGWQDMGRVVAPGVWTAGSVKRTKYGDEAYRLGKSL